MSRRWFFSLVVALGAVGVLAGATAASADFRSRVHGGEVLDRVASILGIERSTLDDAFEQAKTEVQNEKQADALAALVADGTLTEAEAAEIGDWLDSRPVALNSIKTSTRHGFKFHQGDFDGARTSGVLNIPSISPELLARLVESGKLSQGDADAIQAWLDARPDAVDKLVTEPPESFEGLFEGITPFGGGGFFRFGEDGERFDFEGLQERLEQFRSELEGRLPGFEFPEGGFFQFDGDGFEFEFRGNGRGFFFRGGSGGEGRGFFPGFGGFGGFGGFRGFGGTPSAPEPADAPEPVNL